MPRECIIFRHQQIGDAVAREVDEAEVGVAPVPDRKGAKGPKALPSPASTPLS